MEPLLIEFSSKNRLFRQRQLSAPVLRPGEILIRVTCCTICGSDLHTYTGRRNAPPGCVLGHEIIGKVAGWHDGDGTPTDFHGNQLQIGQRVTWAMAVGCGRCFFCRSNLSQKCDSLFKYGHEPCDDQQRCSGPTGGLSDYCVLVPGTPVFSLPESLTDEAACPANCATATVCAAIRTIEQTHPLGKTTALVVGAGMLGMTAVAQLNEGGARQIVVVDPNRERLQLARSFGATHCLDSADQEEVLTLVKSISDGRGADIALDFAGVTAAVETCITMVRVGGCVLLAGSVFPSDEVSISPEQIVRRMITIRGLHNYLPEDIDRAIRFLERTKGRFPFHQLVEKTFTLQETQQAFEYALANHPVRVAVRPVSAQ